VLLPRATRVSPKSQVVPAAFGGGLLPLPIARSLGNHRIEAKSSQGLKVYN